MSKLGSGEAVKGRSATLSEAGRAQRGADRLPASRSAAVDALVTGKLAMDAFGPLWPTAFMAVKPAERVLPFQGGLRIWAVPAVTNGVPGR